MPPPEHIDAPTGRAGALLRAALREHDAAGLAAFRVLFGVLVAVSAIRFELNGWVEQFFVAPSFFFHHWGFEWVRPLPAAQMHALFAVMAVAGVCIAAGALYRVACVAFFLAFTYVELCDVTNYLNHYYLVSLLGLLFAFLPLNAAYSVDALVRPAIARATLPAWVSWLLRFQVGVVYFFAAIAKAQPDWLLHGQPLGIWLSSRTDLPVVGPYLDLPAVALAMSWGGFLYDLTIPLWLSLRRTRPFAYAAVLGFHTAVGILFPIGMFPWIMIVSTTIFFAPDWPRRLWAFVLRRAPSAVAGVERAATWSGRRAAIALVAVYVVLQVIVPLRTFAYGGDVLWHERGMRWSWRVMVREKNASVVYRVRARGWSRERIVSPDRYLTAIQEREMGTQPDLVLQLAHHIRDELEARGLEDVEVRADVLVSLNGRAMARLVDPEFDLAHVEDDPLAPAPWILPSPGGAPPTLGRRAAMVAAGRTE